MVCDGCSVRRARQHHHDQPELPDLHGVSTSPPPSASATSGRCRPRVTVQDNPNYFPAGSPSFINPTGQRVQRRASAPSRKYMFKAQGSYPFPWDITASANFNWNQGATRTLAINGPGRRQRPGWTPAARYHDHLQHAELTPRSTSSGSGRSNCSTSACRNRSSSAAARTG